MPFSVQGLVRMVVRIAEEGCCFRDGCYGDGRWMGTEVNVI